MNRRKGTNRVSPVYTMGWEGGVGGAQRRGVSPVYTMGWEGRVGGAPVTPGGGGVSIIHGGRWSDINAISIAAGRLCRRHSV